MFAVDLLLVLGLLGTLGDVLGSVCNETCPDKPVFTPSTLVVKYGGSTSATCVACEDACLGHKYDLEVAVGSRKRHPNSTTVTWIVANMTQWDTYAWCYYNTDSDTQCCTILNVIVFHPPESVSMSILNHTGPMFEHEEYTLQCTVRNVAPVEKLAVTFYMGLKELGRVTSKATMKEPITETFILNLNASKEDDGAGLWCQAQLELGPSGPQPPLITVSQEVPATVYYGPDLDDPATPQPISVTEGRTLQLNCSAVGNPPPSYTWTLPSGGSTVPDGSVLTVTSVGFEHGGQYVCNVTSNRKTVTVNFSVNVQVDFIPYIIAGVVIAVALACFVALMMYMQYYKQRRMGQYNLKDVFRFHARHIAVPGEG